LARRTSDRAFKVPSTVAGVVVTGDDSNIITAVVGLGGVIIGGVLSGLVQLWIETRRNRNAGEAAAALISEELLTISRRSSAFLTRQVDWDPVVSTDAWDAYKTPLLLAVPQGLGYVLVTTYGVVDNAQRTARKRDRDRVALILRRVAWLAGQALLRWRRTGQVEDDLIHRLEQGMAEADALFAELREIRLLEVEERVLIRVRVWIDRASNVIARLSKGRPQQGQLY
jgi:hypothetical protein